MRVIVTGSRDWPDMKAVCRALDHMLTLAHAYGETLTVVHGGCPTGADAMASAWCQLMSDGFDLNVVEQVFEADWEAKGRAAGPIRNRQMIESGATYVLAFSRSGSRGTSGTVAMAEAAGIPVMSHRIDDKEAA